MRKLLAVTIVLLLTGLIARSANAATITFSLDCTMTDVATCGAPTGAFGTIVVSDDLTNSNWVDITATLTDGTAISKLFLNYDHFPIPAGYTFSASGAAVAASEDGEDQGKYGMAFDIVGTPKPGPVDPFTTVLKLQNGSSFINLDASDFDLKDVNDLLYAAVNPSGSGPQIGALESDHGSAPVIPEPSTLTLLGLGAGAMIRRRRSTTTDKSR